MPSALIAVNQNYAIIQWNIEAEKMTGINAKLAVGEQLAKLFPKLHEEIIKASQSRDLLQQNLSFQFKTDIDNELRTLEVMMYPISALKKEGQGEVIRIDDVTDKLKINETLVQTEKMLSLGGLAAGMAHEINNPLGAIMQTTQNIKRRLSDKLDRSQALCEELSIDLDSLQTYLKEQRIIDFLDSILISGQRAAGIVSDMLSFARPANKETTPVSLQETLDASVRLSAKNYDQRKQFDFRTIDIRKHYAPDVEHVMARKNQLQQVFLNLLVNAAQALGQSKTPNPIIEINIRREGRHACIEVIDNGPGMDDETRKRVFEPFFTTKNEQVGTGLGLSVSYFIITEQLRGSMSVESQLGKGTRFIIHLPLVLRDNAEQEKHDEQIELPL
jgi:PAS domain S-box-containing protein